MKKLLCTKYPSSKKRYVRCSEEFGFMLPHEESEDAFYEGIQSVLNDIRQNVNYIYGVSPKFKFIDFSPADGDTSEFGYNITYTDDSGEKYRTWVAFRSPDEDGYNWTWDGNIYDRNDEMLYAAKKYAREAGLE